MALTSPLTGPLTSRLSSSPVGDAWLSAAQAGGFAVLDSDGNSFDTTLSVLNSSGTSFTVSSDVLDSDGNSFSVI